jgi:hypothetical protein
MTVKIETMHTNQLMAYLATKQKVAGLEYAKGEEDDVVLVFESVGNQFMVVIEGEAEALVESFSHPPLLVHGLPEH